jgi:hypothetical protein
MIVGVDESIRENVGTGASVKLYMVLYRNMDFSQLAPAYEVTQTDVKHACSIITYLDCPLGSHKPKRHPSEVERILQGYLPELLDIVQYFPGMTRDGTVTTQVKAAFFMARLSGDMDSDVLYKCASILIDGNTEQQDSSYNIMFTLRERLQRIKLLKGVTGGSKRDYPERLAFASTLYALEKMAHGDGNNSKLPEMSGGEISVVREHIARLPIPEDRKPDVPVIPGSLHAPLA